MELKDLEKQLAWANRKLFDRLQEQPDLVEKEGKAEYAYRVALASKMLDLKASGQKVTLIPDLAKGDSQVASLRLEYHIASGLSDSNREAVRATQSSLSTIQGLVAIERAKIDKGLFSEGN
jgi:hypothetical protein